jgi:putative nucleotidyltransferase with HDIG domain
VAYRGEERAVTSNQPPPASGILKDRSAYCILVTEDEPLQRANVVAYLEDCGFRVAEAGTGRACLDAVRDRTPHLVLLDLRLPEISGMDVLTVIRREHPEVPVIILSGTGNFHDAVEALHLGAADFLVKPIQEMAILDHAITQALERAVLLLEHERQHTILEQEIERRTEALAASTLVLTEVNTQLQRTLDTLEKSIDGTISTIAFMAEIRDPYTAGHQQRVASLSSALARQLGLSAQEALGVYVAAMLHDIGKISVPLEILVKPGRLTELEVRYIQGHPQTGHAILKRVEFPWPVADVVLQHHERENGTGYPQGLRGEDILLPAKIIAVADTVEAMASHRPYRSALGLEPALLEIREHLGVRYDGDVVRACVEVFMDGYVLGEPATHPSQRENRYLTRLSGP